MDEFAVRVNADINPFQRAIQKITGVFTNFGNMVEQRELKIQLAETIEDIRAQIKGLEVDYFHLQSIIASGKATQKQKDEYSRLGGIIRDNYRALTEATNEFEKLGDVEEEAGDKGVNVFKGLFSQVKKYGFAVLGVTSAFNVFKKAMSTALSNNIELSNKFQAVWTALGNALTPLLEKVANLILKAFSYLNVFVKAISGGKIDLLAKTSNSAKSTASSLKEANKQLAGFDELNNLDDTSGGGAGGGLDFADAFSGIDIDTNWADKIQAFGEWCKLNWPIITGAVLGAVLAFSKLFDGFKLIEKVGIVLMFAGLFEIIKGISDFIEGVFNGDLSQIVKGFGEIVVGIGLVTLGFQLLMGTLTGGASLIIAGVIAIGALIIKHKDEIARGLKLFWENVKAGFAEGKENIKNMISRIAEWFRNRIERIKSFFVGLKDKSVEVTGSMSSKIGEKMESLKNFFKGIINGMIGMVEGFVNKAISGINWLIRRLNKIRFDIPDWIPLIGGKTFGFNLTQVGTVSLPRLDTGTNYVPNDQLAMIHKGEAVIPKKFNSSEYFNNDDVLEKLDRFMEIVEDIDFNTYLDGKKVSKEVTRYQRQQERIMGGAY